MVSRSLCRLAVEFWDFFLLNSILPIATHVPGTNKSITYSLSRKNTANHEWELNDIFLCPIFKRWGRPQVGVFTTRHNSKCKEFCSRSGYDL